MLDWNGILIFLHFFILLLFNHFTLKNVNIVSRTTVFDIDGLMVQMYSILCFKERNKTQWNWLK